MGFIKIVKGFTPSIVKQKVLLFKYLFFRFIHYGLNWRGKNAGIRFLSDGSNPTFFGYHDKTPFSSNGGKILATSITANDKDPSSECAPMKIGYFTKTTDEQFENKFIPLTETTTLCFQQGCMLQWNPIKADTEIFYNDLVRGKYGAKLFDINEGRQISEYSSPIYAISPLGDYATSVNFSRLGRLRPGYGYGLLPDISEGDAAPSDDGLFLLSLNSGEQELIVSLNSLAEETGDFDSEHYINHATFSPDGEKISFFHLWLTKDKKRCLRLCVYNLKNQKHSVIESKRIVSHYCWITNHKILVTTKKSGKGSPFYLTVYDTKQDQQSTTDVFKLEHGDTHPMQSPVDKNMFVLDSYPDKVRDQKIFLFNIQSKKTTLISSLYSPIGFTGTVRCDLHPRWDREGNFIVFDTAALRKRQLALLNVKDHFFYSGYREKVRYSDLSPNKL